MARIDGTNVNDVLDGSVEPDQIYGLDGDDEIDGQGGDDELFGGLGDDTIDGGAGNDLLEGGEGSDSLNGGIGDDTIQGGAGADLIRGEAGSDTLDYSDSDAGIRIDLGDQTTNEISPGITAAVGSGGHAQGDIVRGMDNVIGSAFDDNIILNDTGSANSADGGAGNDDIIGSAGANSLVGGAGNDTLTGKEGADTLEGGADSDVIFGDGGDVVDGGSAGVDADTLNVSDVASIRDLRADSDGNGYNGTIVFNDKSTLEFTNIETVNVDGRDAALADFIVEGTAGNDTIDAGYLGDPHGDRVDNLDHSDGSNDDVIHAGAGHDSIIAGLGDDSILAGSGNDTIDGDGGAATGPSLSGVELLQNGSFEDGTHAANGVNGLDGWSNTSGSPDSADDGAAAESWNPNNAASDGTGYVTMWANSSGPNEAMQQTLAAPLVGGTTYTLRLDAISANGNSPWFNPADIPVNFEILDASGSVLLGSVVVQGTEYNSYSIEFTPVADVNTIIIRPNTAGEGTYPSVIIDNLSLQAGTISGGDDTIDAGDGEDFIIDSTGNDSVLGGEGKDNFDYTTITGNDTVVGGEVNDTSPTNSGDKLNAHDSVDDLTVIFDGDESGMMSDDSGTVTFSEIEHILGGLGNDSIDASASNVQQILDGGGGSDTITGGSGDDIIAMGQTQDYSAPDGADDVLVLKDGFGDDSIEGFETPTETTPGVFSGNDLLDVAGLQDATGNPVNVDDVTVTDSNGNGTGDAILQFPNGESITLWGVSISDVSSDAQLIAMGIPAAPVAGTITINDAIELSGSSPANGAILITANGDLVEVDDGLQFSVADSSAIAAGDTTTIGGTVYTVTAITGVEAIATYNSGANSVGIKAHGITLDDGAGGTLDYIVPVDDMGNLPDITQIEILSNSFTTDAQFNDIDGNETVSLATTLNYIVEGTAGNDTINAAYLGDPEGDRIDALDHSDGSNADSAIGGDGDDTILGLDGNDTLYGGDGITNNDASVPDDGNDSIEGGVGDDFLYGESGDDTLLGGIGHDNLSGSIGNDSLVGGDGNDSFDGGAGNDTIDGGSGNDYIFADNLGGNGSDSVDGGAGNDTIFGLGGADTLYGGGDNDLIYAGDDADLLAGDAGADTIYGEGGDDVLYGDGENDSLVGGLGNDQFWDGTGDDISDGGADADRFYTQYNLGDDTVIGGETGNDADTLISFKNVNSVLDLTANGTAGDNESGTLVTSVDKVTFSEIESIELSSGDDQVIGSTGDDSVSTGSGQDTVDGGAGNDSFDLGSDGNRDIVVLSDGDDSDTITNFDMTDSGDGTTIDQLDVSSLTSDGGTTPVNTSNVTVTDTNGNGTGDAILTFPGGESITLVGVLASQVDSTDELVAIGIPDGRDYIVEGTAGNDTIDAGYVGDPEDDRIDNLDHSDNSNDDSVEAYDGNDLIYSGEGDDTISAGTGHDTVYAGNANDIILGEAGDDVFYGEAGADTISGGTGSDLVEGGTGNDDIYGGDDADTIFGGAGLDEIAGDAGNDKIDGGADADKIDGGAGQDTIEGGAGDDYIEGGTGEDLIFGSDGADTIRGDDNNDTVYGGTGNDDITLGDGDDVGIGGDGNDTLFGGAGNDQIFGDEPLSLTLSPGGVQGAGTGGAEITNLTDFPTDTMTFEMQFNGGGMSVPGPDDPALTSTLFSYGTASSPAELSVYGVSDNEVYDLSTPMDLLDTVIETGYITVDVNGASYTTSIVSSTIFDGSDHSLALTFDATAQEVVLFLDGSPAETIALVNNTVLESSGTLSLGQSQSTQGGFAGEITESRLWDDIRTNSEINEFHDIALEDEAGDPDLISNWTPDPFTEGFRDDVGNNNLAAVGDTRFNTAAGAGDDVIFGGDGSDTLIGSAGDDTLDGDNADIDGGADYISGGSGNDQIIGDVGDDTLYGGGGNDEIYGGADNDLVRGGGGSDTIFGQAGNDTIDASGTDGAADQVYAGDDRDYIYAGATDTVDGGAGGDDFDTLDLTGSVSAGGTRNVVITGPDSNGNGFDGYVEYFDNLGASEGQLTFSEIENIVCFTKGTVIRTPSGERRIETLSVGDKVVTRDNGLQRIRWIGQRTVVGQGSLAPISFTETSLRDAESPLLVSPQHRVLFTGYEAELLFGEREILIPAKHLVNGIDIKAKPCAEVTYIHIMFDSHEIIYSNGQATESFFAGETGLDAVDAEAREELFSIFPELRWDSGSHGETARLCLKAHEAAVFAKSLSR